MAEQKNQVIALVGPPGVGKSTLGAASCAQLGLRFLDFSTDQPPWEQADPDESRERLLEAVSSGEVDVVAMSWSLMADRVAMKAVRRDGEVLLLWDHPLTFQARARVPTLMTPSPRIKTRGGFGNRGTSCQEYRRLKRASHWQLALNGLALNEATARLTAVLEGFSEERSGTPAEQAGIDGWVEELHGHHDANKKSANVLADVVGRYRVARACCP